MFALLGVLANHSVNDGLQNILFGKDALHVFDQVVGLGHLIILEVVNHQVESCLWDNIDQGWKDLESVLATPKNDKVMSEEIVVLENVTGSAVVLKGLEFRFCSLPVV